MGEKHSWVTEIDVMAENNTEGSKISALSGNTLFKSSFKNKKSKQILLYLLMTSKNENTAFLPTVTHSGI